MLPGNVAISDGHEGEALMRDWMAFAIAAVVTLLTKMWLG